jgi:hypothetical protein
MVSNNCTVQNYEVALNWQTTSAIFFLFNMIGRVVYIERQRRLVSAQLTEEYVI